MALQDPAITSVAKELLTSELGTTLLYSRLSPSTPSIRLLHLQPGSFDPTVVCTLSMVFLSDKPVYEALSYEWGPPIPESEAHLTWLELDRQFKTVRPNLLAALQRLRRVDEERILWIDALCINQDDLLERNSQVALMGQIYTNARRVVIWLGEVVIQEDGSGPNLVSYPAIKDLETALGELSYKYVSGFELRCSTTVQSIIETILYDIGDNPYWKRVWIVQEVVLASMLIIQYGDFELNPETVYAASLYRYVSKSMGFGILRQHYKRRYQDYERDGSRSFLHLLSMTRESRASDPRDFVYALLGLVEGPITIPIDYSKSVVDVYRDAVDLIQKQQLDCVVLRSALLETNLMREIYGSTQPKGLMSSIPLRCDVHELIKVDTERYNIFRCEPLKDNEITELRWLLLRYKGNAQLTRYKIMSTKSKLEEVVSEVHTKKRIRCEGWRVKSDGRWFSGIVVSCLQQYQVECVLDEDENFQKLDNISEDK